MWKVIPTSSGAYKIQAKLAGSQDLCLMKGTYVVHWANKHGFTEFSEPQQLQNGITPYSSVTSGWNLDFWYNENVVYTANGFYDGPIYSYIITE